MLQGPATVTFFATDLAAAGRWYTELLGVEPYFEVPGAYLEFRIGALQTELGLIDSRFAPHPHTGQAAGAVLYWHVDDLGAALERLLAAGATVHEERCDRGHGFVTASVVDPFGNIVGIMTNPHYRQVLTER
jgi:predicted enzyme related to lactoylglutathione lyase